MTLYFDYAAASDRGLVRGNNEDSAYAGNYLLALADGMGGHAAGEVASQLMIRHLAQLDADPEDLDMAALLGSVAEDANQEIRSEAAQHVEYTGMGTTLTALLFNGTELALCHVGDSRGYRLRDGKLTQITKDDTFVQSLVDQGKLSPEDVSTHPRRSVILKAYTGEPVDPTLESFDAQPGDRWLLCSDGLSDPVTHSTIESTLSQGTPEEAARRLVDLALRSGGPDNVTVVIADIKEGDDNSRAQSIKNVPQTVGALAGEPEEDNWPDSSAGRAAAIQRRPATITPDGRSVPQPLTGHSSENDEPPLPDAAHVEEDSYSPRNTKSRWVWMISALVAVIALLLGGWALNSRLDRNFYLSVTDQQELLIQQGANYTIFGHDLHSPYQLACIDGSGDLRLLSPEDATQDRSCQVFKLNDLPESARGSVSSMPSGSYDSVKEDLQRLAAEALPACVTREGNKNQQEDKAGARTTPGVDCRIVQNTEEANR
ncbi:SpoIIE family protein phosphatase [Corynebacterium poyangense]|uniref:SpoIIE family protein phosphatase n=1 Tax=Corynebacterium poyangense TaxID=2684405 RepID=A0A7H0SKZ8_9CORY|nr:PP2C family serine/threonine-protein phosphatase [Corynebacterium poyangense]QNQ89223.1 SpoIIE family protein phosphatase [Corynebacterium poyangense]